MNRFELILDKPLEYGEKKIEKLIFDFESLTGNDIIEVEKELSTVVIYPEGSAEYLGALAAKAAGVSSVIIRDLPAKDFFKVKAKARVFINMCLGILKIQEN